MKDVLRVIDRGEAVTVLYRGKAKATLVPIPPPAGASDQRKPKTRDQPLFGMWHDRDDLKDPASYLRNLRQPRPILGGTGNRRPRTPRKPK